LGEKREREIQLWRRFGKGTARNIWNITGASGVALVTKCGKVRDDQSQRNVPVSLRGHEHARRARAHTHIHTLTHTHTHTLSVETLQSKWIFCTSIVHRKLVAVTEPEESISNKIK
jgi:hypothetical protein